LSVGNKLALPNPSIPPSGRGPFCIRYSRRASAQNTFVAVASAVPTDLQADELNYINELRVSQCPSLFAGGPQIRRIANYTFEDYQNQGNDTADTNDFSRLQKNPSPGEKQEIFKFLISNIPNIAIRNSSRFALP
jgi:hypothetical protein